MQLRPKIIILFVVFFILSSSFSYAALVDYTYDQLDRITRIEADDGSMLITYTFDSAGNRLTINSYGIWLNTPDVNDAGVYTVDNTSLEAGVTAYDERFGNLSYSYALGTDCGLTDVQDWNPFNVGNDGSAILDGLDLPYGKVFVSVIVENFAGDVIADTGCSNGVTIIDPGDDPDNDGYTNEEELIANSNPFNPDSTPGTTTINLYTGFNLISFPAEILYYENIYNLMEAMGSSNVISRMLIFDPDQQALDEVAYDEAGQFYGENLALLSGQDLMGMIVYVKQDFDLTLTSKYCPSWELKAGTNLVGSPCVLPDLTVFLLLQKIGEDNAISIQRFNPDTGNFETASYLNGEIMGIDFPIRAGEGYFIYMKQGVLGFRP